MTASHDPFRPDLETMQRLGRQLIDRIAAHLAAVRDKPATRKLGPEDAKARLPALGGAEGTETDALIDQVCETMMSGIMHLDHPRFFGFIPGPSSYLGFLGETLMAGFNVYGGTWLESSVVTQAELDTAKYLADACGLPESSGGMFLSGGSMANLSAMVLARDQKVSPDESKEAVVFCSDETHSSVAKALRILGFRDRQLVRVTTDARFRIRTEELERAIQEVRSEGRHPFCVVANAGTTNTGAIDPLGEIAKLCSQNNLWLHVDAAYGGAIALSPTYRGMLNGIELADSICIDAHKWLFQPYGIGCLLARDVDHLRRSFSVTAHYLTDAQTDPDEINFFDWGPELTRPARGLRLWFTLQAAGTHGMAQAIERGIDNAKYFEKLVEEDSRWEAVTPSNLGIVAFRYAGADSETVCDEITAGLVDAMVEDGTAFVSGTRLFGRPAVRACTIHPALTQEDLRTTLNALCACAETLHPR